MCVPCDRNITAPYIKEAELLSVKDYFEMLQIVEIYFKEMRVAVKNEEIKNYVKENMLTKHIYKLYKIVRQKYHYRRRIKGTKKFIDKGAKVLIHTQSILKKSNLGIDFFFAFGTALGIIRDGVLISRDMDIDMIVFAKNEDDIDRLRRYLWDNGYQRLHSFKIETVGCTQDAFIYDDIMIDINYAKRNHENYCAYLLYDLPDDNNKVLVFPFSTDHSCETDFYGMKVNVPGNKEIFLKEIYGESWMIPNKNYVYWNNPQALKTPLRGEVEIINRFKYC